MSERMSDRIKPTEIEFMTVLRGDLANKFLAIAEQRHVRPVDLAADILETVIKDDLFVAVLDA